jgi:hypothetical protein
MGLVTVWFGYKLMYFTLVKKLPEIFFCAIGTVAIHYYDFFTGLYFLY